MKFVSPKKTIFSVIYLYWLMIDERFFAFSGKWLGTRQIRCNWATKGATSGEDKMSSDSKSVVELTSGVSGML